MALPASSVTISSTCFCRTLLPAIDWDARSWKNFCSAGSAFLAFANIREMVSWMAPCHWMTARSFTMPCSTMSRVSAPTVCRRQMPTAVSSAISTRTEANPSASREPIRMFASFIFQVPVDSIKARAWLPGL
jgi:hypothetical protein